MIVLYCKYSLASHIPVSISTLDVYVDIGTCSNCSSALLCILSISSISLVIILPHAASPCSIAGTVIIHFKFAFYFMFTFTLRFSQTSLIMKELIKYVKKFNGKVFHDRENSENRFSECSYFMKGFKKYIMNISR